MKPYQLSTSDTPDATDRILLTISWIVRVALFVTGTGAILVGSIGLSVISFGVLGLTYITKLVERRYKIDIPLELEIFTSLFLVGTLFLGEVGDFYSRFWWWDLLLHFSSATAFGLAAFLLLYVLYYHKKLQTSPFIIAVMIFSFAVMIGVVWEIFEFSLDNIFGLNTQKSGIADTMGDLIVDSLGGLAAAITGYFYIKDDRGSLARRLVTKLLKNNPQLLRKSRK